MNNKEIEIHSLICSKDLLLAINNFKSLQKFEEFQEMPVYLHDDGSLSKSDANALLSSIKNSIIIERKFADENIRQYIKNHKNCLSYRLEDNEINLWHKIKLFDYFYFSKTKKVLGVDADLLFLRKPNDLIENLNNDTPFYFPDVQSAYCFNEPKDIQVLEKVNTGLIYISSEDNYSINDIENALNNLIGNKVNYFPSWIEQSAFAHMFFKNGKYVTLDPKKYRIPYFQPVEIEVAECLHFVSYPAVRDTYKTYVDYLEFENEELIFEKKHIIKFEDKEIPLNYNIKRKEDVYVVSYYWGLEKTSQNFLDHIFEIKTEDEVIERKLQSENTGFFVFSTKSKKMTINHTCDWFGETNWETLDEVILNEI